MADLHAVADMNRDQARRGPDAEGLFGLGARVFGHRRTVAEVPMSVLLSGGTDSSLITGLLAETGTPDLRTYAFGFETVGGHHWYSPLAANTDAGGAVITHRRGFFDRSRLPSALLTCCSRSRPDAT